MGKKKLYSPTFFYSVGDTVIRRNTLNEIEAELTGIDYSKPQHIVAEEKIDTIQLIYFENNPKTFHNAYEYLPYGETLVQYNALMEELKLQPKEGKKKGKKEKEIKEIPKQENKVFTQFIKTTKNESINT